jgi:uncharacterized protein
MITVDANLLIYAVNDEAPLHKAARHWWEAVLNSDETIGLSDVVLLAFLRLTTRPGVFSKPLTVESACDLVESWIRQPNVVSLGDGFEPFRRLLALLRESGTGGNLTSDAHLAALALSRNAELYTADSDFSRFANLRWRNPLA